MSSIPNLENKAQEIISLSKKFLTDREGIFIRGKDMRNNIIFPELLIDELGDFLPFFAYFGDEETCLKHIRYTKDHEPIYERAFSYTDLLFGLSWYGTLGKHKDEAISFGTYYTKKIISRFFGRFPGSYYVRGFVLPVFNTQDSTFMEIFTEFYRSTRDVFFLNQARRLFEMLSENKFFKREGMLPELIITIPLLKPLSLLVPKKFNQARVMKHNTNFGFGLLDLWRLDPSEKIKTVFHRLYRGLEKHISRDGGIGNFPYQKGLPADLVSSFAVADLMADGFMVFKKQEYLELAKRVAHFWMARQSKTTGLFPKEDGSRLSYLDNETDMAIVLFKLWEITGEQTYHDSAMRALEGIFTYHKATHGYVLEVDINSGKHEDELYKTKFNTLLLKPIIYLLSGKKIYNDNQLFMLMKDR